MMATMDAENILSGTPDSLAGQVAVVTGASSGIGRAIALGLAKCGASLCLLGRRVEELRDVVKSAGDFTPQVACYQIDLNVDSELHTIASRIKDDFGQVDILVHSAGMISLGRLESASIEELDRHYRINVRAPYLLTQLLLPQLKARSGQIVFINSSAGLNASLENGQYAASKHALKAIADSLRQEVNSEGMRVVTIYPGRTATPMQEAIFAAESRDYCPDLLIKPEQIASLVTHILKMPLDIEVTDIQVRPRRKL